MTGVKLFRWVKCTNVEGVWYLEAQLGMQCLSSEWWLYIAAACVCTALFVIGIPLGLVVILWQRKNCGTKKRLWHIFKPHKRYNLEDVHTQREFGTLYMNYEPKYWYCPSNVPQRSLLYLRRNPERF